jgi:hypothetical protein
MILLSKDARYLPHAMRLTGLANLFSLGSTNSSYIDIPNRNSSMCRKRFYLKLVLALPDISERKSGGIKATFVMLFLQGNWYGKMMDLRR